MIQTFADAAAMVAALKPEEPVYCYRPHELTRRARAFVDSFPGEVLYAVKCNPEPLVVRALWEGGIRHFDTASLPEIAEVRALYPEAGCYYMHPVKSRESIRAAYDQHGIRHYVVDHPDELEKLSDCTGRAGDVVVMVRLATARGAAVYDLGGKFGCTVEQGAALLSAAKDRGLRAGVCFHVGSQCLTPTSYLAALKLVRQCLDMAGVEPAVIDVGGGFPTEYVGSDAPPLGDFMEAIRQGLNGIRRPADCCIWCEPGRGMVASGASLVVRVEMRRDGFLYLNDGVYGSLCDLKFPGIHLPMRVVRPGGQPSAELAPFGLFGPTCDCYDQLPGPYMLPADVREGDWIEIGQAGAYTTATRTRFNGFFAGHAVIVQDEPFLPTAPMRPNEAARLAAAAE
ncbi:type III PLP-dependent enzyme [Aerophototrophica crusticola]|uniref:ornithine decarboxylase n=1 Tax=Aerophototrophica crusticola TaxID=1709002 RepID=A0A858R5H8_9PROT|nr:type III PLP-dependent enzyme [Rhodospirillaceae bacterium B3]